MHNNNAAMNNKLPMERQVVEVRVGNGDWQPATYRDGEFIDLYGMPLDRKRIAGWRPANSRPGNQ